MSTTNPTTHRSWATVGGYYEPDGPPKTEVHQDALGLLVRLRPFDDRIDMQMTISRWRALVAATEKAINEDTIDRLTQVAL